jgi:hypothetical protein
VGGLDLLKCVCGRILSLAPLPLPPPPSPPPPAHEHMRIKMCCMRTLEDKTARISPRENRNRLVNNEPTGKERGASSWVLFSWVRVGKNHTAMIDRCISNVHP